MEDIVTRLRRAVDNEPFMLGGEHDLLKDALREITTLLGCCDGAAAQDAHIRREREEHRAEVERHRAEIERLREVIRTIRARCVELDDSDAVSETLDIATAVLEDEP